jgi:hypothetical protein
LSHVVTKEYGHTDKFWDNFSILIKKSVELGLYEYKNYNEKPVNYCNKDITYTPYDKK